MDSSGQSNGSISPTPSPTSVPPTQSPPPFIPSSSNTPTQPPPQDQPFVPPAQPAPTSSSFDPPTQPPPASTTPTPPTQSPTPAYLPASSPPTQHPHPSSPSIPSTQSPSTPSAFVPPTQTPAQFPPSFPLTQSPPSPPLSSSHPLTQNPHPNSSFISPTQSPRASSAFVLPTQPPPDFPSSFPLTQFPPSPPASSSDSPKQYPHSSPPFIPPTQSPTPSSAPVPPTQSPAPRVCAVPPIPNSSTFPPAHSPPPSQPNSQTHPAHTPPPASPPSNPFNLLESLSRPVIHLFPSNQIPPLAHYAANALDLVPAFTPLHLIPSSPTQHALRTDCAPIDKLLKGGIPTTAAIFEISGAAGTGKSQLAMQLAVMSCIPAQHGGLDGACVMLFTEAPPTVHRLRNIEAAVSRRKGLKEGSFLSRILVERVGTADELQEIVVGGKLGFWLRKTGARVVIVDSIAALYRVEFEDPLERAVHLSRVAAGLKQEVGRVDGVCICVNQVTTKIGANGGGLNAPALGRVWGGCVEHRVELRRRAGRRMFRIVESCCWEQGEVGFAVSADGVVAEGGDA